MSTVPTIHADPENVLAPGDVVPQGEAAILRLQTITTGTVDMVLWDVAGTPIRGGAGLCQIMSEIVQAVEDASSIFGVTLKGAMVAINGEHVTQYSMHTIPLDQITHPQDRGPLDNALHEFMLFAAGGSNPIGEPIVDEVSMPLADEPQLRTEPVVATVVETTDGSGNVQTSDTW